MDMSIVCFWLRVLHCTALLHLSCLALMHYLPADGGKFFLRMEILLGPFTGLLAGQLA